MYSQTQLDKASRQDREQKQNGRLPVLKQKQIKW